VQTPVLFLFNGGIFDGVKLGVELTHRRQISPLSVLG